MRAYLLDERKIKIKKRKAKRNGGKAFDADATSERAARARLNSDKIIFSFARIFYHCFKKIIRDKVCVAWRCA